jgi:hypothetical protein
MPYIDVTRVVRGETDPSQYSGSCAEHGPNAARITFSNARIAARDDGQILNTPELVEAARDHFAEYGAWSREELAAMSAEYLGAMVVQEVANEMRESGLPLDPRPCDWRAYYAESRAGRARGSLCQRRGRVFFYLGS